jgi:cell wall-associated NlpC family hydrolase
VDGDGYLYESLSSDQIDEIIAALYENYSDMTSMQETVLRYALSKVGCAYDQAYHGNLVVDIFDCSSLAYRSYLQIGTDISNAGAYSAAEECRGLVDSGKIVEGEMKPGDLIFYGGSDNGRYLGIYHVAIYVGRINGADKMVEARGTSWGVVYCDARSSNVVKVCRPL